MKRLKQTVSPIFVILCVLCFQMQSFLTFISYIASYYVLLQVYRQYGPPYVGVDPDIYYEYHTPKSGSQTNNYMWKTQAGACSKKCGTGKGLIYDPRDIISYKIASAPSEDSDQTAHLRSLIRVFARQSVSNQGSQSVFMRRAKSLIRLRGCAC